MEALQMLEFRLKQVCLNFMDAWITQEQHMLEDDVDSDVLRTLANTTDQDGIDLVIQSIHLGDE